MSFYYFAFGSNLLKERLQLANPSAQFVCTAKLEGHKLTFNSIGSDPLGNRWKGGAATILEHPEDEVWGCVWKLDNEHRQTLDKQEACYHAKEVDVISPDSLMFTCLTYYLPYHYFDTREFDDRPSPMYLDVIIKGAVQNKLPERYINNLRAIAHNEHHDYEIEVYVSILRLIKDENQSSLSTNEKTPLVCHLTIDNKEDSDDEDGDQPMEAEIQIYQETPNDAILISM